MTLTSNEIEDDGFEYERLAPEGSRVRRVVIVVGVLVVVALVIAGGFGIWVERQINPSGPQGAQVRVTVPTGSSTGDIATMLEDHNVISNSTIFRYFVKAKARGVTFLAGDFVFREHSSMSEALRVLKAGPLPPPSKSITVPPGLTLPQIAAKIVQQLPTLTTESITQLLASGQLTSPYLPPGTTNLEGYLFPDTYQVPEGVDAKTVLQKMVAQFNTQANNVGLVPGSAALGLSPYQTVIIASLIEREAKIPEDQPKIARVIYNRLAQSIPLGIDSTICYFLAESPCSLKESDLTKDEPYNTRLHTGLPPTPIAAPGLGALQAALHPADGNWIYYVLDPNAAKPGGHFFTNSESEFERVKKECEQAGLGCG